MLMQANLGVHTVTVCYCSNWRRSDVDESRVKSNLKLLLRSPLYSPTRKNTNNAARACTQIINSPEKQGTIHNIKTNAANRTNTRFKPFKILNKIQIILKFTRNIKITLK